MQEYPNLSAVIEVFVKNGVNKMAPYSPFVVMGSTGLFLLME